MLWGTHLLPASRQSMEHDPPILATSPAAYPSGCPPIHTLMSQLAYSIVGHNVKCLAKVKVNGIHLSSLIHKSSNLITEGQQAGDLPWFIHGKSMLTASSHHYLLCVPRNVLQEESLHDFLREKSEANQSVCSQVACLALFEGGCNICLS